MSAGYKFIRWVFAVVLPLPATFLGFFLAHIALAALNIPDDGIIASGIEAITFGSVFSIVAWNLAPEGNQKFATCYAVVASLALIVIEVGVCMQAETLPIRQIVMRGLWIFGAFGGLLMKRNAVN